MPVTEQVLIEFVPDTTGLDSTIETLHSLGKVDQETYDLFKKNNAQYAERVKAMEAMNSQQAQLTDKTKQTEKGMEALSKSAKSLSDNLLNEGSLAMFDKLAEKLKVDGAAMKEFEEGALQGMLEELDRAGVSVDEFEQSLKKLDVSTDKNTKSQGSLKSQLKELREQMGMLKLSGADNTAEYEDLRTKAGEVSDAIGDVNQEVARSGSDTSGLDKLISTSSAVIGGYQVMQGAMALVGDENKDLQESFVRLQAGMSLLQGLQAIGNELAREDSLIKKGLAVANTITAATQRALGIATVETSVAFKVLRGAIIATGIGALVVAIGMVIANWDYLKQKFIEVKDRAQELYEKFAIVRYIVIASAWPLMVLYKALKEVGELIGVLDDEATAKLKDGLDESALSAENLKNKLTGQAELLEAIGGKSLQVLEIRKRSLDAEEEMIKKKLELAVLNEDEEKITELTNDLHKNKISHLKLEDEIMDMQVKKMKDQGASELEILNYQKERITQRINELEVIIKQAEAMQLLSGGMFDTIRDGFVGAVNQEIEALKNKMNGVQTEYQKSIKDTKEKVEKTVIKPNMDYGMSEEEFNKFMDEMQNFMSKRKPIEINGEIVIEQEDMKAHFSMNEKIDAMTLQQKKKFYADMYSALLNSRKLNLITAEEYDAAEQARQEAAAETEVSIEERKQERIKQMKQTLMQFIQQTSQLLLDDAKEKNRTELDDRLTAISNEKSALEELYKSKSITEGEYLKQKKIIERQEVDAKRRAWQRDKELAMYDIGLKTAQAAMASFVSMGGGPQGALAAAAAIAFGLIQEALVATKEPPKFSKGTKKAPPGWKWVGEEGPELINTPGGEEIKTHADSMAFANLFNRMDQLAGLSSMSVNSSGALVETNPEYKKLISTMEAVKDSMDNVTIQQNIFDRRGYHNAIIEGDNVTYVLGERF